MHYSRSTQVCCARQIEFDLNPDGTVHNIVFHGGLFYTTGRSGHEASPERYQYGSRVSFR